MKTIYRPACWSDEAARNEPAALLQARAGGIFIYFLRDSDFEALRVLGAGVRRQD